MTKEVIYKYLGTNGIIESPVHLEDIYYVRLLRLVADKGHMLTDGTSIVRSVKVAEADAEKWTEIEDPGQN